MLAVAQVPAEVQRCDHHDVQLGLQERRPDDLLEVLDARPHAVLEEGIVAREVGIRRCVVDDDVDQLVHVRDVARDDVDAVHLLVRPGVGVAAAPARRSSRRRSMSAMNVDPTSESSRKLDDGADTESDGRRSDEGGHSPRRETCRRRVRRDATPCPPSDCSRRVSWDVTSQPSTLKATRHAAPATKSWMVPWSNSSMSSCAAENRDSTRNTHHAWTLASTGALRHDHRGGSGSVARQMSSTICFGRTRLRNGTNHAPAPQPGVKRRSVTLRAKRLR